MAEKQVTEEDEPGHGRNQVFSQMGDLVSFCLLHDRSPAAA